MSGNYKIQLSLNEKIYDDWKRFLQAQGYVLYGKVTHLNSIAMEEGIKAMMKDKKKFKVLAEATK